MATVIPQQAPAMEVQAQQAEQQQQENAITGVPEIDQALIGLMQILPSKAAPQLEALVQALEMTLSGGQQAQQPPEGMV